jgi:hypothetical protein
MALTETQVVANELERVEPTVPTLFDRDSVFYANIEKRPVEKVSNRDMRVPLEMRPGGLFGHFDPAGGDLGRGEGPTFDKALVNTVHLKHAVEWHKKADWATDDSRKSVLQTFRYLLAKSMSEFRRHVDSLMMTSGNGVVGTISAVSNSGGFDTYTLGTDGFGARLVRYGQKVNVYLAALSGLRHASGSETSITYLDLENKQIKVATVTGAAATDVLVLSGLSGATPVSLLGVPYHHSNASTGTWLGLDRALNPEIRASRVNANSSPLSLPFPRLAVNKLGDRVGIDNGMKFQAWMHPCQVQQYEELGQMVQVVNKEAKQQGLDLYFDVQQLAGVPIKKSYSWDKKRIDFIVNEAWGRAEMNPAGFYTEGGRKVFELRGASGGVAAASIFYIVASFNLFMKNPTQGVYIDNLAVPTGY